MYVHDQLSAIKRQKANPVINYNSVNILAAVEVNSHISQQLANTSGIGHLKLEYIYIYIYYVSLIDKLKLEIAKK